MANNFKDLGHRIPIATASGTIVSGALCAQEGFAGIALNGALVGQSFMLGISGRYNIAVPANTAKGDVLFIPGASAAGPTEAVAPVLTRTGSNANTAVCKAIEDRRADGTADVLLLPPAAGRSSLQV